MRVGEAELLQTRKYVQAADISRHLRLEEEEASLASELSVAALGVGKAMEVGVGNIRVVDVSPALIGSIDPTWKSIVPLFLGW